MLVDDVVRDRLVEAEGLLVGLAVPGSAAHSALLALELAHRAEQAPEPAVVLAAIEAVAGQSELSLRAGRHAEAAAQEVRDERGPHWLLTTVREWQRYLRWLVSTHEGLAGDVAALPDEARAVALLAWQRAADGCAAARAVWGAIVLDVPADVEPAAPVVGGEHLDTVVVGGRLYVSVDELGASLRSRARAFADVSAVAAKEGDALGELVSDVVATELGARADALDLAAIEHASTCTAHDHAGNDNRAQCRCHPG